MFLLSGIGYAAEIKHGPDADLASPPPIGSTTPAAVYATPAINKGPAIITTFAGTVSTSGSSTTITFTSAADAILAGYNATNPVLGTTLITTAVNQASVTRYVVSWTNSTICVVDTACTLAASSTLASVQLPIATFVNSSGGVTGWITALGQSVIKQTNAGLGLHLISSTAGMYPGDISMNDTVGYGLLDLNAANIRIQGTVTMTGTLFLTANTGGGYTVFIDSNNIGIGTATFGTSAVKVLAIGGGTMPTALVADAVQMGVAEYNGATGDQRLNIYSEATVAKKTAIGSGTISINGAVTSGGGLTRQLAEATGTPAGTTTNFVITLSIPTGARLLGCQLRVDTALTAGETWKADYSGGSTTAIAAAGQAVAKNTKINKLHVDEIATNTTNVTITRDAGNFTNGVGVIRAIAYYEALDILADAP